MKLGKVGFLVVILASSTLAFSHSRTSAFEGDEETINFLFSQARGCGSVRAVYENLSDRSIQQVGPDNFVITGSLSGFNKVVVKIRRYTARGPGGFGPSGWIDTYSCVVEKQ
jgi:hypothetical protein